MSFDDSIHALHLEIVQSGGLATGVDDRALRRSQLSGERVRLRRGVYVSSDEWRAAAERERQIAQIRAVSATRQRAVIGYQSAAILWGYPHLGAWPREVHLVSAPGSGVHSRAAVREHRVQLPGEDVTLVDGLQVTTPLRTLVDVARSRSTLAAVVMIDHALNHDVCAPELQADLPELDHLARDRVGQRGRAKVRVAIGAARVGAASAGESWSRLLMADFGMPEPALQTRHANPRGGFYYTDFEWPELKIIGEFDGRGKYLKPEYLGSMSPGEAVVAEKVREDHLRAQGNRVARWMFDDLRTPTRLRNLLTAAGVPTIRK